MKCSLCNRSNHKITCKSCVSKYARDFQNKFHSEVSELSKLAQNEVKSSISRLGISILMKQARIILISKRIEEKKRNISSKKSKLMIRRLTLKQAKIPPYSERNSETTLMLKKSELFTRTKVCVSQLSQVFIRSDSWINICASTVDVVEQAILIQYILHYMLVSSKYMNLKLPNDISFDGSIFVKIGKKFILNKAVEDEYALVFCMICQNVMYLCSLVGLELDKSCWFDISENLRRFSLKFTQIDSFYSPRTFNLYVLLEEYFRINGGYFNPCSTTFQYLFEDDNNRSSSNSTGDNPLDGDWDLID